MLGTVCPSTFSGHGFYEVSVSQTLKIFRKRSPKFEHVWRFGRHTLHHSRTPAISGSTFPPLRPQAKGESPRVAHVIDVSEMGPGTLIRTPVPCARVMMTLASRGKLPQINSIHLIINIIIIILIIIIIIIELIWRR